MRTMKNDLFGSPPRTYKYLAVMVVVGLLAAGAVAWSDGADSSDDADSPNGGSLGSVEVADGEAIQIRAVLYLGPDWDTGYVNLRVVRLAVEHYGRISGFDVHVGVGLNDECTPDGGRAAAETIVADRDVVGVVGTTCSVAAVEAAPVLGKAGLVTISPTNTSPALTSDLAGNPGEHRHAGYYRTAHNDLHQGRAVAQFLHESRGLTSAAAVHTGDVYTQSLAEAFVAAFEDLGGKVTSVSEVSEDETDMAPTLRTVAAGRPQALFLPVSNAVGSSIAQQAPDVMGMEDVLLIGADGLLDDSFLGQPETEGMFFSGPEVHFGDNRNQSTGMSAPEVLAAFEEFYGVPPSSAYWGHAYDATTLLLDAIEAASSEQDGALVIDRAEVRAYLDGVAGYAGLIGEINCDPYGDCGRPAVEVIEHLDATDIGASRDNAVYEYAP